MTNIEHPKTYNDKGNNNSLEHGFYKPFVVTRPIAQQIKTDGT